MGSIDEQITNILTHICRILLFFLHPQHQSLIVSIVHYSVFIIGFYYFFFHTVPGDKFRIIFFGLVVISAASYFLTNRCFMTTIERKLSQEKNAIQKFIDKYFGEEIEGNPTSKIVLSAGTLIIGAILLVDRAKESSHRVVWLRAKKSVPVSESPIA